MKLVFSQQDFKKYINIKLNENLSSRGQVVACRWTDGYDEVIIAFFNFTNTPKNL
jgi:hypothetical protein